MIRTKTPLLGLALGTIFLITACSPGDADSQDNICGQAPCYQGPFAPPWVDAHLAGLSLNFDVHLTHDNRVLETGNFLVFSDASQDGTKIRTGETAEAAWKLISGYFQITPEELGIRDQQSKIRVYAKKRDRTCATNAYYNGFTVPAWDGAASTACVELIPTITRHEFTHVTQFRLGGLYGRVWDWLSEGLAEHVSGGVYPALRCRSELDAWRRNPAQVNPITVQFLNQLPDYDTSGPQRRAEYYPVFALAVRYLLDPRGHGKTFLDLKAMFRDIGQGMDFLQAFEIHMGMTVFTYENRFYEWMEGFLPEVCE